MIEQERWMLEEQVFIHLNLVFYNFFLFSKKIVIGQCLEVMVRFIQILLLSNDITHCTCLHWRALLCIQVQIFFFQKNIEQWFTLIVFDLTLNTKLNFNWFAVRCPIFNFFFLEFVEFGNEGRDRWVSALLSMQEEYNVSIKKLFF